MQTGGERNLVSDGLQISVLDEITCEARMYTRRGRAVFSKIRCRTQIDERSRVNV